ncbi:ketopantoate reductase family protein [Arthrobacter sp.]|uniref:ketopantoate reductase family protein n=1 Tax=Arthrobacter sp. TaxID=1667 RepID=UPI0026E0F17B|nr:2-dehydropantoate 2-reductase N-terminal domain-containing protein [Arthrobacter sp.]MDO5752856.1 2-dehydropantoate 2-reductase N-terminal domain-containing protein [Arthrobacter sp.]
MRILVLGAGVIGSVYAGKLMGAGHEVVMLARGERLAELQDFGLIMADSESGEKTSLPIRAIGAVGAEDRYDVVVVAVRAMQLTSTLTVLGSMDDGSDVLFMGNTAGLEDQLVQALGGRVLLGFPAAGGVQDGVTTRYVLIKQQKTMLGEPSGTISPRTLRLKKVMEEAGFPAAITADMPGWLLAHAAFIVPMSYALYKLGTDAPRLAADRETLRLMVRATAQAFRALQASGNTEIPANLRTLYLRLPAAFAVAYWRRVLASPKGELWFAGPTRGSSEEMGSLAHYLQAAIHGSGGDAPELTRLLPGFPEPGGPSPSST